MAYDLYRRWRPQSTDHQLVLAGKITTVAGTILAIAWSPLLSHYGTIYDGLARLVSYVSPPITAVFLLGVFWKNASGKGAFITLTAGGSMGAAVFALDLFGRPVAGWLGANGFDAPRRGVDLLLTYVVKDFLFTAFLLFVLCGAILVAASKAFPERLKEEAKPLVWNDWREPLRGPAGGRGLANYRIASAVLLAVFVGLYVVFR
jgi:SSS family solute:Na+ symporter